MGDIVVLLKAALNPEMVRSKPDGTLDQDAIPLKLSDIDRNAVEEAAKLKQRLGGKVIGIMVLTVGPVAKREKDLKMAVQEALAKGVDEAIVVADDRITPGDQVQTAKIIAEVIRSSSINPSIILASEATIDETTGQIPGRVAAKLGLPYISFVRSIEVAGNKVIAERDLEEELEKVEAEMPVVVSVTQEINQPRPPTLIQIRRAARKPQKRLGVDNVKHVIGTKRVILERRIVSINRKQQIIEGSNLEEIADKLIDVLEKEGVIKL
ncbi:MAG: electron transfer flavoprotein subunit beta/FixA family protein [Desulfurococcales archaeon]|nr:electron transfer flavoprotein subunit beta/FixA family protein [Desulfurococcales archaeon]MCE4605304.1 electron transfer flavoprotein subunit beta/FixA family protein [Desulfurococcales archaeon]